MTESYQRLWAAVLEQAIKDVRSDLRVHKGKVKSIFNESAWSWFYSENQDVGSFHWICNMLSLDPNFVLSLVTQQKTHMADSKFMAFG